MQDARIMIRCGGMRKDCDWLQFDRKINGYPRIIKCDKVVTYYSIRYLLFIAFFDTGITENNQNLWGFINKFLLRFN